MICILCNEEAPENTGRLINAHAHQECVYREVIGGIGHHIAHEWWCLQKHDPDAGLTRRQSALMVWQLSRLVGPEVMSRQAVVAP